MPLYPLPKSKATDFYTSSTMIKIRKFDSDTILLSNIDLIQISFLPP